MVRGSVPLRLVGSWLFGRVTILCVVLAILFEELCGTYEENLVIRFPSGWKINLETKIATKILILPMLVSDFARGNERTLISQNGIQDTTMKLVRKTLVISLLIPEARKRMSSILPSLGATVRI